jgi:hypothetical protein
MSSPLRIFQVASGNVGTEMIRRVQNHPDLELVGLHCYSPDKIGRDVGDIAGIESVTCIESVDVSCHHSAETWQNCGYGRPVDDPEVPRLLELGTRVFEDGVRLMADCLDIELDPGPNGVRFLYELGACTKDVDLGWYQLPAGSLGGCVLRYIGTVDDIKRVELRMDWQMTPHTDPHWDIQGCYITKIDGDPCIYSKHMILPKPGTVSSPSLRSPRPGPSPRPKRSRRSA